MFDEYFERSSIEAQSVSAAFVNSSENDTFPSTSLSVAVDSPPLIPSTLEKHSSLEPTNSVDVSNQEDNVAIDMNEFVNPFSTPILGDPSKPVMMRSKLATDAQMCAFALTASLIVPRNTKEAMADYSWIKAMQDELHKFQRLFNGAWHAMERHGIEPHGSPLFLILKASFDYRLNPLYAIKECSSCGALYTTNYCCSEGGLVDKIICDLNKTPDSSQRPPPNSPNCGDPVDGLYCRPCAFVRKCLNEGWFIIHDENEIINTSESSNDDTNVIPICYDDDDDEESSIPLKDIIIFGLPSCVAITPVLLTKEPVDSLIMEDEHLDTILATKSDEVIKSSVENLVQTPSESESIPDSVCDMPLCDNPTPLEAFKEHSEIVVDFNDDFTSSDDDSPYGEDIEYVDASPPYSKLVSLEVVENVTLEDGEIEDDVL
ncbi:hypothetical protein Tco_0453898, partial [Tanacetum coccineum]